MFMFFFLPLATELLKVIVLVSFGGGFGGLLYWTSLYLVSVDAEDGISQSFRATKPFLFAQIFMGIGGAWALLLVMLWGRRAPMASSVEDILLLFATSLVAGFAGGRLLPMVADQLTRQFLKDAEERVAKSAAEAARSELTSEVYTYLDPNGNHSDHQTQNYIGLLTAEIKKNPLNRKAVISLARIFHELRGDAVTAIKLLEVFIEAKLAQNSVPDGDVADACWNIANYNEMLYASSKDRRFREAAFNALAQSVHILPGYIKSFRDDPDFDEMRSDPEAKTRLPTL